MARFPDSQKAAVRASSQAVSPVTGRGCRKSRPGFPRPCGSETAYSGGTVWDLHPLRVAAGVSVRLSGEYSRVAPRRLFCVTLVGSRPTMGRSHHVLTLRRSGLLGLRAADRRLWSSESPEGHA